MKRVKAIVSGKVQGVGFRMHTLKQAKKLNLKGYVRNLSNGNVEIVAEGEDEKVDSLINWAKSGSPLAVVESIRVETIDGKEKFLDFVIRF